MKKILIILFIIFFASNAFGGKGGSPLVGQWWNPDGKDYLSIVMDNEYQRLFAITKSDKASSKDYIDMLNILFRNQFYDI